MNFQWLYEMYPLYRAEDTAQVCYILFTVIFFVYYFIRYKKDGILSLDTYLVARFLYVPLVVMFPLALSPLNVYATADLQYMTRIYPAFYISLLGIVCVGVGALYAKRMPIKLPGMGLVTSSLHKFWLTRSGAKFACAIGFLLVISSLLMGFRFGHGREMAMADIENRPLMNLVQTLLPFLSTLVLTFAYIKRSKLYYVLGGSLIICGLLTGTRHAAMEGFITFMAACLIVSRARGWRSILAVASSLTFMILVAELIGFMRMGFNNLTMLILPVDFFYGNNLSDLRDFAWVFSGWNGHLLAGKTMLAGYLSFIPSSMMAFRREAGWGRFSTVSAGLNPETHPGLRPGIFGEAYFNFGILGVVIAGVCYGYVVYRLYSLASEAIRSGDRGKAMVLTVAGLTYIDLFTNIIHTPGFFANYVIGALLIFGLIAYEDIQRRSHAVKEKSAISEPTP